MKFSDLVGSIEVDPTHLQKFIDIWFREGDEVLLRGIPVTGVRHVMNVGEDVEVIRGQTKDTLENKLSRNSETLDRVSMYIQMNPLKDKDDISLYVGSKVKDIRNIYGCFIDLDVKEDGFDSKEDVKAFLEFLEVKPTIVIDNGVSGGMHAYWRFEEDDVKPENATILRKWWAYMVEKAMEFKGRKVKIDKLTDITRVSRMPSSIYWPREGQKYGTIIVAEASGVLYPYDYIDKITEDSFNRYKEYLENIRKKTNENRLNDTREWWKSLSQLSDEKDISNIKYHISTHHQKFGNNLPVDQITELSETNLTLVSKIIENFVNDHIDWSEILEPHGWTLLREKANSRVWARPGRNERSAETDYSDDGINTSSAMSLLSSSDETGLADLKDAGVVLTKSRVMLRLDFEDDFKKYLTYLLSKKKDFDNGVY